MTSGSMLELQPLIEISENDR